MKRNILFLSLILASSSLLGCSNSKVVESKPIDYIKYNLPAEELPHHEPSKVSFSKAEINIPKDCIIIFEDYVDRGYVGLINEHGYVGLFSLIQQKFLINPAYKYSGGEFEDIIKIIEPAKNHVPNFLFRINEENKTTIIDELGNVLYEGDKLEDIDISFEAFDYEESFYYELKVKDTLKKYTYDSSYNVINFVKGVNNIFNERKYISLDKFNLKGYYLASDDLNTFSVYDENHKLVKTTRLNIDTNLINESCLFDGSFIYQYKIEVEDTSNEYTYYDNDYDDAYILKTYKADLLSGEIEELKNDYYFRSIEPYYDENGIFSVARLSCYDILNKTRKLAHRYIVDKDLNILQDITQNEFYDLVRIDNYYYDLDTGAYYDLDLKFKGYAISEINVSIEDYFPSKKCFLISNDETDKYNLYTLDGKEIFNKTYEKILINDYDPNIFLFDEGKAMLVNFNSKKVIHEAYVNEIDAERESNIILTYNEDLEEVTLITLKGEVEIVSSEFNLKFATPLISVLNGIHFFVIDPVRFVPTLLTCLKPFKEIKSFGIIPNVEANGETTFNRVMLKEGENKFKTSLTEETYLYSKFVPTKSGFYTFNENKDKVSNIVTIVNGTVSNTLANLNLDSIYFEKGYTYFIDFKYTNEITINLTYESEVDEYKGEAIDLIKIEEDEYYKAIKLKASTTGIIALEFEKESIDLEVYEIRDGVLLPVKASIPLVLKDKEYIIKIASTETNKLLNIVLIDIDYAYGANYDDEIIIEDKKEKSFTSIALDNYDDVLIAFQTVLPGYFEFDLEASLTNDSELTIASHIETFYFKGSIKRHIKIAIMDSFEIYLSVANSLLFESRVKISNLKYTRSIR